MWPRTGGAAMAPAHTRKNVIRVGSSVIILLQQLIQLGFSQNLLILKMNQLFFK